MTMSKLYQLDETRIPAAGVMRCCLQDVAMEYEGKLIAIGSKSTCPHCKREFTLTKTEQDHPIWKPTP